MNPDLETTMSAAILESVPLDARATDRTSTRTRWAGRIISGLAVLFLAVDVTFKFNTSPEVIESSAQLGWQLDHMPMIGMIEIVLLVLYLIPRTAPLGAILWTGYLGGAIATHVRVDNPLFSHILFPIYVAAFIWGGLYLRDARVRALLRPAR
jgi:hypothetical protein